MTVDRAYFQRLPFAEPHTGELFASYCCLECGYRSKTWDAFRQHRALGLCRTVRTGHQAVPAWQHGTFSDEDRAALDALYVQVPDRAALEAVRVLVAQLPDPDLDGPLATLVDLHA